MSLKKECKKNRGENKHHIVIAAVFIGVLILPMISWMGLKLYSRVDSEIMNRLSSDLGENRKKAAFPDKFSSGITTQIENFYNDRVPYRSKIIAEYRKMNKNIEKLYTKKIEPVLNSWLYTSDADHVNFYFAPKIYMDLTIQGRNCWLFYNGDSSLDYYQGINNMTEQEMQTYTEKMQMLTQVCKEQGKQLYFFIAPNKEQVYSEYMPTYEVTEDYKRTARFVDYVKANSDVNISYPLNEIRQYRDKYQLYYKNDTHWNRAGAFIGIQSLYRQMGINEFDLSDIRIQQIDSTRYDLVKLGGLNLEDYSGDCNYSIGYKTEVDIKNINGVINEDDLGLYTSESSLVNAKKLVLVGDSFRTSMIETLEKDFKRTVVVHNLLINNSTVITEMKNSDVIVVECVERFDGFMLNYIDTIRTNLSVQ